MATPNLPAATQVSDKCKFALATRVPGAERDYSVGTGRAELTSAMRRGALSGARPPAVRDCFELAREMAIGLSVDVHFECKR